LADRAEKYNVIEKYPAEAKRLKQLLKSIEAQGTRPGYKNKISKEVTINSSESENDVVD
jgi:hypothetical protein